MTVHHETCPICASKDLLANGTAKDYWVSEEVFSLVRCSSCSVVITQEAPDKQSIGKYYQHDSYISHTDTSKGLLFKVYHWVRTFMLKQKARMVSNHSTQGRILEVGAGTGYFLQTMISQGWEGAGVEPDKGAARLAADKLGFEMKKELSAFENKDNQFDAISMWHVLEHVHDLNGYMKTFHKILKPQGTLVVAVPNYTSFDADYYSEHWAAYDVPKHLWHFSPKAIDVLAKNHGFEVVKHYALPFDPFYIAMLSEKNGGNGAIANLRAFFIGFFSFMKATFDVKSASSVVYILKKQHG